MATGTLGTSIGREMNVYISNDGGIMWREVRGHNISSYCFSFVCMFVYLFMCLECTSYHCGIVYLLTLWYMHNLNAVPTYCCYYVHVHYYSISFYMICFCADYVIIKWLLYHLQHYFMCFSFLQTLINGTDPFHTDLNIYLSAWATGKVEEHLCLANAGKEIHTGQLWPVPPKNCLYKWELLWSS